MERLSTILIIDDEMASRLSTHRYLHDLGSVHEAANRQEALGLLRQCSVDLILLDLKMPDVSGYDFLKELRLSYPSIPVIVLTSCHDVSVAVQCLKYDADDYILKEEAATRLHKRVSVLLSEKKPLLHASDSLSDANGEFLIPKHSRYQNAYQLGLAAAKKGLNILISGPTGSGKDVLARYIHQQVCPDKPFVALNCGAIVENLAESEFFGSESHAYTGANDSMGKLEAANGGILFLDELSSMPLSIQVKLLRVLETGEFFRVGGNELRRSQFIVISATNEPLKSLILANKFRSDLFYRLKDVHLELPALQDLPELIPEFISFFEAQFLEEFDGARSLTASEKEALLSACDGNVRSLKKEVRNAIALQEFYLSASDVVAEPDSKSLKARVSAFEQQLIRAELELNDYNISHAAKVLDIKRSTLSEKIKRYGIPIPDHHSLK